MNLLYHEMVKLEKYFKVKFDCDELNGTTKLSLVKHKFVQKN